MQCLLTLPKLWHQTTGVTENLIGHHPKIRVKTPHLYSFPKAVRSYTVTKPLQYAGYNQGQIRGLFKVISVFVATAHAVTSCGTTGLVMGSWLWEGGVLTNHVHTSQVSS